MMYLIVLLLISAFPAIATFIYIEHKKRIRRMKDNDEELDRSFFKVGKYDVLIFEDTSLIRIRDNRPYIQAIGTDGSRIYNIYSDRNIEIINPIILPFILPRDVIEAKIEKYLLLK